MGKWLPAMRVCIRLMLLTAAILATLAVSPVRVSAASSAGSDFIVGGTEPGDGATNVVVGANVTVKFNHPLDETTVNGETVLVNDRPLREMEEGSVVFPEEGSCVLLFRQHSSSVYTLTLTTGIKDKAGTPLAKPYVWHFATVSGLGGSGTPVRVFARYPRLNDMRVPTNAPITMVFTTDLDAASLSSSSVSVTPMPDGHAIPGKITVEGMRLVFRPDEPMKPRRTYEVQLAAGIKSKSGDVSEKSSSWQFTTGEGPGEGPIVADCWYESHRDNDGMRLVFHAATENLVKPAKTDKADKSGKLVKTDPSDKPAAVNAGALPAGYAMKGTIVSLSGLLPQSPLSTPNDVSASDLPISNGSAATVVQAAYTHGGGGGQGNSVGGNSGKDPEMEKVMAAVDKGLAGSTAVVLQDSGDVINHGDQTKGDGVYSGRLSLDKGFPSGQAFVAFSIVLPDGKRTEPVTISLYVMPPAAAAPTTSRK